MQLFGDMVQKGFQRLYGNKDLSDVTLILDPKGARERIYTHKMVLCAWSEMFRAMLSMGSSWREAKLKELPIELDDARSYSNFKLMLKYMYTGETDFIKGHNILDLISLSNYYGILSLKEICGEILGTIVNDDNLLFLLQVVDAYEVRHLEALCGEHLAENFGELLEEGKLDELGPSTWAEMIRSDNIQVRSEEQIFEAVMCYADQFPDVSHLNKKRSKPKSSKTNNKKQDAKSGRKGKSKKGKEKRHGPSDDENDDLLLEKSNATEELSFEVGIQTRDEVLNLLLPCVRWAQVDPSYMVHFLESDPTLSHLPLTSSILHHAYKCHLFPPSSLAQMSLPFCPTARLRNGFYFDTSKCHTSIAVTNEFKKATVNASMGWINVKTKETFDVGQTYCEFKIEAGSMIMIGVVSGASGQVGYAGQWSNGWTYYNTGQVYHLNTVPTNGAVYTIGDRVGVGLSLEEGVINFYKNGVKSCSVANVPMVYGAGVLTGGDQAGMRAIACLSGYGCSVSILPGAEEPGKERAKRKRPGASTSSTNTGGSSSTTPTPVPVTTTTTTTTATGADKDDDKDKSFIQSFLNF